MSRLRANCTARELAAHQVLGDVRSGVDVAERAITWALKVLGEKA